MEVLMELFSNLPVILAVALFLGIVALVRLLLAPDSAFERRMRRDRRQGGKIPVFPFYDKENNLVSEDRRSLEDRRSRMFVIRSEQKRFL